jgi:hypothetical protein
LIATMLASPASADGRGDLTQARAREPVVEHIQVPSDQAFTPTTIELRSGQIVTISATGTIHFGGGKISKMTPKGIAWGKACSAIASHQTPAPPWPAEGHRCWSLIAKVGFGQPFEIGTQGEFRVGTPGELFLGVNDNSIGDNYGKWSTTVTISPAPLTPTPAAPTKHTTTFVVVGALLLAGIVLIAEVWRRRSRRNAALNAPEPMIDLREPARSGSLGVRPPIDVVERQWAAVGARSPAKSIAPTDNNGDARIAEVEFSDSSTLRVGYNHFSLGSVLQWKVTQDRAVVASGYFITRPGDDDHVETVPLGVVLRGRSAQPREAEVQLDWTFNGVPYRYAVRRPISF